MSKEHIWPQWAGSVSAEIRSNSPNSELHVNPTGEAIVLKSKEAREVTLRTMNRVCQSCNNGWMSVSESSAKPMITKMILGESVRIEFEDAKKIAYWIALRSTCFDASYPAHSIICQEDRTVLLEHNTSPRNWQMFVGKCDARSRTYDIYRSRIVDGFEKDQLGLPANSMALSLRFGQLLIFVIVHYVKNFDFEVSTKTGKCDLVNPGRRFKAFDFGARGILTPGEVGLCVQAFHHRIDKRSAGTYRNLHPTNGQI